MVAAHPLDLPLDCFSITFADFFHTGNKRYEHLPLYIYYSVSHLYIQ